MSATPRILIAGGGTGGHVFPALAVADQLKALAEVDVTFVGTARGLEARVIPQRGYDLELLDVEPMKGGGVWRAARGAAVAGVASVKSLSLLRRLKPRAVLSVGGYAAGPVALAAATLGIPVALVEPNCAMGLANRILAPLASRAYFGMLPDGEKLPFVVRAGSIRILGVPIRSGFEPSPYRAREGVLRALVLGGSQGAVALNERLPEAFGRLREALPHLTVLHQSGRDREADVRAAYERERFPNVTVSAFVDDVAAQIADADVVIARSGASTLAEITAIGRASVLVPFPFAADDHQAKNAAALAKAGGCIAIRQEAADAVRIANELRILLSDGEARTKMADRALAVGRPQAAYDIAYDLLRLARVHVEAEIEAQSSRMNGGRSRHDSGNFVRARGVD